MPPGVTANRTLSNHAATPPTPAAIAYAQVYNWLVGAARFQQQDYARAETALMRTMTAADVDPERRRLAASGLVGVYARLHRPVDQLRAAFELNAAPEYSGPFTVDFDASYLLDVQLTDSQLEAYLRRYSKAPVIRLGISPFGGAPSLDAVRYALAVRYARREEYPAAADPIGFVSVSRNVNSVSRW